MEVNQLATFGDTRRLIFDSIADMRAGKLKLGEAEVVCKAIDIVNKNIQVEINVNKLVLATEGKAHSFGRVVGMGQRLICNDASQPSA